MNVRWFRWSWPFLCGALSVCFTPVRAAANPQVEPDRTDLLVGPLFDGPVYADYRLPPGQVELLVRDARIGVQGQYNLDIPATTRTGQNQKLALRLRPKQVQRIEAWVESHQTPGPRALRLEVTIAEATVQWRALETQEREKVRVQAQVRLLEAGSGAVLTSTLATVYGHRDRYDASNEALLDLLGDALVATVHRGLAGSEQASIRPDAYPSAAVVDPVSPAAVTMQGYDYRGGVGGAGGVGLWLDGANTHAVGALRGYTVFAVDGGFLVGLGGGLGVSALANHEEVIEFELGPRVSYLWIASDKLRVEPSATLLTGMGIADEGAFEPSTASAPSAVVDNGVGGWNGGGGSSFNPSNGTRNRSRDSGDTGWLVAGRLGLGLGLQPGAPDESPGLTLEPYVQLSGLPKARLGPHVSFGVALYVSFENWEDPAPRAYVAPVDRTAGVTLRPQTAPQL